MRACDAIVAVAAAATWLGGAGAAGQERVGQDAHGPGEVSTPAPPADLLAGPSVETAETKRTLVKRDFQGRVVRLELDPAEAAVRLLELDEGAEAAAERVLLERSAMLDELVLENLTLLGSLAGAADAGDEASRNKYLQQLWAEAQPILARGRLIDQLQEALPAEAGNEVARLHREYWQAVIAERRAEAVEKGERARVGRIVAEEAIAILGRELRRSYERVVTARVQALDALLMKLELSPEEEGVVRRKAEDLFQKSEGRPSRAQVNALVAEIYWTLDERQRRVLLEEIRGGTDEEDAMGEAQR